MDEKTLAELARIDSTLESLDNRFRESETSRIQATQSSKNVFRTRDLFALWIEVKANYKPLSAHSEEYRNELHKWVTDVGRLLESPKVDI